MIARVHDIKEQNIARGAATAVHYD